MFCNVNITQQAQLVDFAFTALIRLFAHLVNGVGNKTRGKSDDC